MKEVEIHILVVDDNKENLRVVGNFLKEKGYKIAFSLDGESALQLTGSNRFDLILLDVMMPEMDGFEVCRKLKEDLATKDIPIIFLTAKSSIPDIVTGFKAGGVDYITKPFNKEELLARVQTHLELKLMREYLKQESARNKNSRDEMMRMLLQFGKTLDSKK